MRHIVGVLALLMLAGSASAQSVAARFGTVDIGHHIVLHYVEEGAGAPVVFVHGSLCDMGYWKDQVDAFARRYRAIAYSRRYSFPNDNRPVAGYSAITDANDLAGFIRAMHLGRTYVVGHSYGALAILHAAIRHPELIRAMVLAEPPAIALLDDIEGSEHARAAALHADIERRMVVPMRRDFLAGRREQGVADFIDYVFHSPRAWSSQLTAEDRKQSLRDAHDWDVMMRVGSLFPPITASQVASIRVPTLIMSGGKSYPFLTLIDGYLATHIRNAQSITFADAGHQMWYQDAAGARAATEAFFGRHP